MMVSKNHDLPAPGDLVEVEYLYMYKGGSLYQPQYKGARRDKAAPDALSSFKVKADVTHDPDDDDTVADAPEPKTARKKKP